ncbi:hypothetical protein ES703_63732 [subsurface metagenome]
MTYEPETKKVELGFGPSKKRLYAVFYLELRHGTQKAVNALTRPFLKYPDGKPPTLSMKEGEEGPKVEGPTAVEVDLGAIDYDVVNDTIIVGQVKEWSFGEVDQAMLDGLPERIRGRLVKECNLLYGNMGPLAKGGGGN